MKNIWELIKKYKTPLFEGLYLFALYFASKMPIRDFDVWFHLKSGELFAQQSGLQFTEIFSYAAYGREWIPFEWLFQVIIYLISRSGIEILPYFIGIFIVLTAFLLLRIMDRVFGLGLFWRLLLVFAFFVRTYEFNTIRPYVLAYCFVVLNLFLIYMLVYKGKKWIYWMPLVTLIWTNLHSTGFLAWGLEFAYVGVFLVQWFFSRERKMLLIVRDLAIVTVINALITVLPPVGIRDYKLLWTFFQDRQFLGLFIAEWTPIKDTEAGITSYAILFGAAVISYCLAIFKTREFAKSLIVLPLIFMGAIGFSAARNVFLGSVGLFLTIGWGLKYLLEWTGELEVSRRKLVWAFAWVPIVVLLLAYDGYSYIGKKLEFAGRRLYYPVQSTEFVKRYLNGRMFNDYTYGGYILYNVYPKLQVLIDGRADVYLCCEMRDYMLLSIHKQESDEEYKTFLDTFWNKYDISFAMIPTGKHNVMRKIAKILNNDPDWSLVFWDDESQVFVRHDGKNDEIIKELEAKAATPYLRDPYVKDKEGQALDEYLRMEGIAVSARNENAIGNILMQKGQFDEAKKYFIQAVDSDPSFESPYMSLGELSVRDGDLETAIGFYQHAKVLARDRGLIYIRLGQLILQKDGDKIRARDIWEDGVKNTIDDDAKAKLNELLATL